jgi:hypothetical protein
VVEKILFRWATLADRLRSFVVLEIEKEVPYTTLPSMGH